MKRLPAGELRELLSNKLSQIVEKPDVVNAVCDGLIWASLRGVDSHGIRLAPHYFDAAKLGRVDVTASPSFDVGGQSFTLGDAKHNFAHYVGKLAMLNVSRKRRSPACV